MPITQLLQLAGFVLPQIVNTITLLRHKDGTATVISELNEGSEASAAVRDAIAKWNAGHPGQ